MRNLFIAGFCLLLITACGGRPKKMDVQSVHSAPVLYISVTDSTGGHIPDTIQMGRIRAGEKIKNTVALINSTVSPMLIHSVKLSCGCTRADFDRHPAQPSDTLLLTFEFDSSGFYGSQYKTITVNTSVSDSPYTLILLGEVI